MNAFWNMPFAKITRHTYDVLKCLFFKMPKFNLLVITTKLFMPSNSICRSTNLFSFDHQILKFKTKTILYYIMKNIKHVSAVYCLLSDRILLICYLVLKPTTAGRPCRETS